MHIRGIAQVSWSSLHNALVHHIYFGDTMHDVYSSTMDPA
jgi:hypothetical protein